MKLLQNTVPFTFLMFTSSLLYSQEIDEYTLKAIWLEKFTHFIEWPENNDTPYFSIGIFNQDPFNGKLESIYSNYFVENRPVKIKHIYDLDSIGLVDILFIPGNNDKYLFQIIKVAKENSVLLISDTKGYAEQGVHINFYTLNNQIRFEINESAIHNSGFFVSFRLLNIAKIVQPITSE